MTRTIVALLAFAALAACGKADALRPPEGAPLPPKPLGTAAPLTTDQLLTPTTQAQPLRVDELLRRSEERKDDRFDLPPPG